MKKKVVEESVADVCGRFWCVVGGVHGFWLICCDLSSFRSCAVVIVCESEFIKWVHVPSVNRGLGLVGFGWVCLRCDHVFIFIEE